MKLSGRSFQSGPFFRASLRARPVALSDTGAWIAMSAGFKGGLSRLFLAGAGGAGVFLAFPNFNLAPLAFVTLVPIMWSVRGLNLRRHFLLGWWAGTVTNMGGFYWLGGMLMDFGHLSWLPAGLITLLNAAYQGLDFALWLSLFYWLRKRSSLGAWLLMPLAWVAVEILFPLIFPWYYANSQYWVIPFIQVCELGGVLLLSFLLVLVNGLLYETLERWRSGQPFAWKLVAGAAAVPLLLGIYGLVRMHMVDAQAEAAPKLKIGLVEADVGIWEKEDPAKTKDNLVRHQRMSAELEKKGAQLIVWPETSYHAPSYARRAGKDRVERHYPMPRDVAFLPQSSVPAPLHAEEDLAVGVDPRDRFAPQRGFTTPLLFGVLTSRKNPENKSPRHPGKDRLNTAILLDEHGKVLGAYDKVYLLIFGEYIPLGHTFPVFHKWLPEGGDLTAGESVEVLQLGDFRIGVMICYEDIIPAFTRKVADKRPNILINVTNDAWFGKTAEPYLHLALAVFRTVENRVPLIRSTNTGVSCFIDANGRILSETRLTGAETLLEVMPMMKGRTLYQILGDWPGYLCLLAVVYLGLAPVLRRKKSKKSK
jgi:apolipoprotein N-acyltransferase